MAWCSEECLPSTAIANENILLTQQYCVVRIICSGKTVRRVRFLLLSQSPGMRTVLIYRSEGQHLLQNVYIYTCNIDAVPLSAIF